MKLSDSIAITQEDTKVNGWAEHIFLSLTA